MNDALFLIIWARVALVVAALGANSFPVLYAFSPWYKSQLGKIMMLLGITLAVALDLSLLFGVWKPHDLWPLLVIQAIIYTMIAFATTGLTFHLWKLNYSSKKNKEKTNA